MKLVITVVQDKDASTLLHQLTKNHISVTGLAGSGGFLTAGNTTLLTGVGAGQVGAVVDIIKKTCGSREKVIPPISLMAGPANTYIPYPVEVPAGCAIIFVLEVEQYVKG